MTKEEFLALPTEERWSLLWDKGIYLGEDFKEERMTYALETLYLHIHFDHAGNATDMEFV